MEAATFEAELCSEKGGDPHFSATPRRRILNTPQVVERWAGGGATCLVGSLREHAKSNINNIKTIV